MHIELTIDIESAIDRESKLTPLFKIDEEIKQFRPYIFQVLSEEVALKDMMNMQGMDFIKGFSGTRMATLTFNKTDGDKRLLSMNETARNEIDNTYQLIDLIKGEVDKYLPVTESQENEDVFVLGPNFVETLYKKIDIMLKHMIDAERRLYESNNR
ncbi:MAG: hypothetical protein HPY74_01565 [Firmicutes bacterium]|nr:hypothetical protein [Bacillota bacterium]